MDTVVAVHERTLELAGVFLQTLLDPASAKDLELVRSTDESGRLDLGVALYVAIFIFVVQWGVRLILVEPVAKILLVASTGDRRKLRERTVKFAQSNSEMVQYGSFLWMGIIITITRPWIWPSALWFIGYTAGTVDHYSMRNDLRFYYIAYGARYLQGIVSTLLEPKRKDFLEMMVHHFATVIVVGLSYSGGYVRVGLAIMCLLDFADVPLHIAKQCLYLAQDATPKKENGPLTKNQCMQMLADVWFVVFAVLFVVTRLGMYPYVVWASIFEKSVVDCPPDAPSCAPMSWYDAREHVCCWLLVLLLILQIYWGWLLATAIKRLLVDGKAEDVRSDSDSDVGHAHAD